MLSPPQEALIEKNAYVPEHIFHYVTSISGAEPFFYEPFLSYEKEDHVFIVGYPIIGELEESALRTVICKVRRKRKNAKISVILPTLLEGEPVKGSDSYYLLDLKDLRIDQKTRNILKRAKREIRIVKEKALTIEHLDLIEEFIAQKKIDERSSFIFRKLKDYVNSTSYVIAISARNFSGKLIAFDIVDTFSPTYAFYMFNVRTKKNYVPGTSDALFEEMVNLALSGGKRYINLGLGINEGVRFFKKKWGGKPFLPYYFYEWEPRKSIVDLIFEGFL
jgi:hypothetical protein